MRQRSDMMRKEIDLCRDWRFHKGDIVVPYPTEKGAVYAQCKTARKLIGPAAYTYFDHPQGFSDNPAAERRSEGWQIVNLPHDYIITQTPDETYNNATGYFAYDNAWYRKRFMLEDAEHKHITLEFGGIAGEATIYLNGCLLKHNFSRYNSFSVDITDYVYHEKENVLAIYVDASWFEGWWYQGAGIYRDVRLVITDLLSIDRYGVYAPCQKMSEDLWQIDFETTLRNDSYEAGIGAVESRVVAGDGTVVAIAKQQGEIPARSKEVLRYTAEVKAPALWSPETPSLYTVQTELTVGDRVIDQNQTRIGFRTVEADPKRGLLINGNPTIIKGVCCHQDYGLTGIAVPDNVSRYKIQLIKEMGANGYRTSHYQQPTAVMDALDEMGFLVMDEARWFESTEEGLSYVEELVLRDRNRPSVIMWSTGNEEPFTKHDIGRRLHKAIAHKIRNLDANRLIMSAVSHTPTECLVFEDCDIIGINYNINSYEPIHEKYPDKLILSSENCATGTTRGWHLPATSHSRIHEKDQDTLTSWFLRRESTWRFLNSKPWIIGGYQWDAIEHRGEAAWPVLCSKSGAIDLFLQKKAAFYQNQSHWLAEPVLYIVPHWNFKGLEGHPIDVPVYHNCDEVELLLNGASLGKQQVEQYGYANWYVPYAPGELTAIGYRDGKEVARTTKCTPGAERHLQLRLENRVCSGGKDLALLVCEAFDDKGNLVENCSEFVRFSVSSDATIIGTGGDHADPIAVPARERRMYAGKLAIAVLPKETATEFTLYAEGETLGYAVLHVPLES